MLKTHIHGALWKSFRNSVMGGEKEGSGGTLRLPKHFAVFTTGQDSKHKDIFCGRILIQLPACRLPGEASGIPTAAVNNRGGASGRHYQQCIYVAVKRGVAQ